MEKTTHHIERFYTSTAGMLTDSPVLTAVSTFLQLTQTDLIEALLLRQVPLHKAENRTIGQGYYHYPKKEKAKSRYITEPLPVLRTIQERIVSTVQQVEEYTGEIHETVRTYGNLYEYNFDSVLKKQQTEGIDFYENPYQKTVLHTRFSEDPYFIHLDIEKAFPSLSEKKIYEYLLTLLASQHAISPFNALSKQEFQKAIAVISHLLTYNNHLATGSPASPFLFHTILAQLDKDILSTLSSLPLEGTIYTRYLDDIIISFSHISTPASQELKKQFVQLVSIYEAMEEKGIFITEALSLPRIVHELTTLFTTTTAQCSDNFAKKMLRYQLKSIRDFLQAYKGIFSDISQREGEKQLYESMRKVSESLAKSLHTAIGALDRYKRSLDKENTTYPVNIDTVSGEIQSLIRKDGWKVNKQKVVTRLPDSPSIKTMLGLGIVHPGHITIPQKEIFRKVRFYEDILTGKETPPRHLQHTESGSLDYRKLFSSIQGYKYYILTIKGSHLAGLPKISILRSMKSIFSKQERVAFRKIELLCMEHFGIPLKDAYDLFFKPSTNPQKNGQADIADANSYIDEREIPWEDAPSNQSSAPVYRQGGRKDDDDLPL